MNPKFLLWYFIPMFAQIKPILPADVAPPGPFLLVLSLGALLTLGLIVLVIVVVLFAVIRTIKKKHINADDGG